MSSSRYANAHPSDVVDARRGQSRGLVNIYKFVPPTSFRLHLVRPGDRWDSLAMEHLGDPQLWWRLADMNPELFDPRSLRPGITIRVP